MRLLPLLALLHGLPAWAQEPVPRENQGTTAPPKPALGDFETRARQLFDAILADDPEAAMVAFFPRDAFAQVKGVAHPERVYDRLVRELHAHVHALHAQIPAGATFERFERSRRCSWVATRQEANAIPYWSCRHNWVHYRVGERALRFEVRTLINWGPRWFVTHLSEFH